MNNPVAGLILADNTPKIPCAHFGKTRFPKRDDSAGFLSFSRELPSKILGAIFKKNQLITGVILWDLSCT